MNKYPFDLTAREQAFLDALACRTMKKSGFIKAVGDQEINARPSANHLKPTGTS